MKRREGYTYRTESGQGATKALQYERYPKSQGLRGQVARAHLKDPCENSAFLRERNLAGPFEDDKAVRLENKLQRSGRTARVQKAGHRSWESVSQTDRCQGKSY